MNIQEVLINLLGIKVPDNAYTSLFFAGDFVVYKERHTSGAYSTVRFIYRDGSYVRFPSHYFFSK